MWASSRTLAIFLLGQLTLGLLEDASVSEPRLQMKKESK